MEHFTFEEMNLMCIYNPGTRLGLIGELEAMRRHLEAEETELLSLTDSAWQSSVPWTMRRLGSWSCTRILTCNPPSV